MLAVVAGCAAAPATVPTAGCADVDVVFARGTGQPPGFGRVGDPFVAAIAAGLPGLTVGSHAVDYAADAQQQFSPGATDLVRHVEDVAAVCPGTRFVLGGYSQGALVVSLAIGVPMAEASSPALDPTLSPRVVAVVAFGNPLGSQGRSLETTATPFRLQSREFCNAGDGVCARRGPRMGSHRSYPDDGATSEAAAFVVARLGP